MTRVILLLALGLTAPVSAQMPGMAVPASKAACAKPVIVPGFEGWGQGVAQPQLGVGRFSELVLAPADAVKYSPPLNRAPAPGSMGGIYALTLTKNGTYRFALGAGVWIDVIGSKGERLSSIAHAHGPDCSGIAKIVDYALTDGDYVVQFSEGKAPKLKAMVIAK